jgi:CHASE3 domain sensor protein
MKLMSSLSRKVQLAFGAAILALLVVCAISYHGIVASSESDRCVRHTREVLENLQELLAAAQSVESNFRGFTITGGGEYVDAFNAGILHAQREETILRSLTMDNPVQQWQFPILGALLNQKIEFGEIVIASRGTKGLDAETNVIVSGTGQCIMILLDLYCPQKDGRQVLKEIEQNEKLKTIPVVILTASFDEKDFQRSHPHHANCYLTKPVDLDQFLRVVKIIDNFLLANVKFLLIVL